MRIVAGRLGGRRLVAPAGEATRPTSDRVREALFSIVGSLDGMRVADLYAGTGALGLEALSRGACVAVFVENAPRALAALRRNIASLGVDALATVVARPVGAASLAEHGPFDVVFTDPPYALVRSGGVGDALRALLRLGLVAPAGCIVLEHDSADQPPDLEGASLVNTRRYGDTSLAFYEVASAGDVAAGDDD